MQFNQLRKMNAKSFCIIHKIACLAKTLTHLTTPLILQGTKSKKKCCILNALFLLNQSMPSLD